MTSPSPSLKRKNQLYQTNHVNNCIYIMKHLNRTRRYIHWMLFGQIFVCSLVGSFVRLFGFRLYYKNDKLRWDKKTRTAILHVTRVSGSKWQFFIWVSSDRIIFIICTDGKHSKNYINWNVSTYTAHTHIFAEKSYSHTRCQPNKLHHNEYDLLCKVSVSAHLHISDSNKAQNIFSYKERVR